MALVTVLLVLVAVVMLAVGTLALTNSSLMIAENQVSASIARAHADAGIDATIAALFESYSSSGSLPQTPPSCRQSSAWTAMSTSAPLPP